MKLTIRALALVFGLAAAASFVVALLSLPTEAQGQDPLPVQYFRQRMQAFDTVFVQAPPRQTWIGQHGEGWPFWVVRWDATRGVGTLENANSTHRWAWWGGQASRDLSPRFPEEPTTFYGPVVDSAIAELWTEVRAGLPNSTFVWVERAAMPEKWVRDGAYRIDLPFAWASAWELYLGLEDDGQPWALGVLSAASGEWAVGPMGLDIDWGVPLRDDFDRREGYVSIQREGGMVWHEEGAVHSWLELDLAASPTASPHMLREGQPLRAFTAGVWDEPCVAGAVTVAPVHLEWTWDANLAESGVRALTAMNTGCTVGVEIEGETLFKLTAGARGTFDGFLTLTDDAGTVLSTHELASSLTAPLDKDQNRWSPHQKMFPLPPGEHDTLRLVLDGELTHECAADGPATNRMAVKLGKPRPMVKWTGCWPDMGIIQ